MILKKFSVSKRSIAIAAFSLLLATGLLSTHLLHGDKPASVLTISNISTHKAVNSNNVLPVHTDAASTSTAIQSQNTNTSRASQSLASARPSTNNSISTPPAKTGIVYGTPHITYNYELHYVDKDSTSCHFSVGVNVNADTWQGYSSGNILVNMVLQSQVKGEFPFTISYTMSPGESKIFTHDYYIPVDANGDDFKASATVKPAGNGGLGETMWITNPATSTDTSWLNCFTGN